MVTRAAIATGDFTAAGTWGTVEGASGATSPHLNAENGSAALTATFSDTRSSAFSPGVIPISHICVKMAERSTTASGTLSVRLILSSDNSEVSGTLVTINSTDVPISSSGSFNGGWLMLKLASPVTLAAVDHKIEASTTSGSNTVSLHRDATASNISRMLITTTTGAPAAGDDLVVAGEYTGAGTSNIFTVTMDNTATTDFGAASTSTVTPSLAICSKGILSFGTAAATSYYLKQSGNVIVYAGGTLNMGTTGTPMPSTSSGHLQFDCTTNVGFGLIVHNRGAFNAQGASKTSWTLLNTNESAAATVIGVDSTTGWAVSDELCFGTTSRTYTQSEKKVILTVDSAVQVTLTAGLTNAHLGTSPTQGEVGNLTRNVKISGSTSVLQTFVDLKASSLVDWDYAEFYFCGSATALKRGIDVGTTIGVAAIGTGALNVQYCSFRDFSGVAGSQIFWSGAASNGFVFSNNVVYNMSAPGAGGAVSIPITSGVNTFDSNLIMLTTGASTNGLLLGDTSQIVTNNRIVSANGSGVNFNQVGPIGTFTGNHIHGCALYGIILSTQVTGGTISGGSIWLNSAAGLASTQAVAVHYDLTFDTISFFGNQNQNINIAHANNCLFKNLTLNGWSGFTTNYGFTMGAGVLDIQFENCNFSTASGSLTAHGTADIECVAQIAQLKLRNTILAATTEVANNSLLLSNSEITSQRHDQTAGNHKAWYPFGRSSNETTAGLFDVTPAIRLTPNSASNKLTSGSFVCAVANGNALTVTVKVRESVAGDGTDYNGNRIRLILKKNVAAGIASDTVLSTATVASQGAFELLSGTTANVTEDAILEFIVDCDGTTGWINFDTWSVTGDANTLGLSYFKDGTSFAYGAAAGAAAGVVLVNTRRNSLIGR